MGRKLTAFCLAICFVFAMSVISFAEDFNKNRLGSISVTLVEQNGKTPVSGAELSVYRVATVSLNESGNLSYAFTKEFEKCGAALNDPSLSVILEVFVEKNKLSI